MGTGAPQGFLLNKGVIDVGAPKRKEGWILRRDAVRVEVKMSLKMRHRASLVAQWLRICLLMQGTRVRALVWEDPICHGATRPVSHNY